MGWVLRAVGLVAVGLGFVGIFLPLLPTTPFLLLAAWCFARSEPRLERWLLDHPRVGPPLRVWRTHRVIPPRAKLLATLLIAGSLLLVAVVLRDRVPLWAAGVHATIALAVTAFLLSRPSRAEGDRPQG